MLMFLKKGLEWGVSLIQLRDKEATKKELLKKAKTMKNISRKYDIPFIVNDFIDIAISVDADGLHTGQDDLPLTVIRDLLGPHKILGRTTQTLEQGLYAQKEGADYVSIGPIWETPSKPGRKGIGFSYLENAKSKLKIPYVAIGGINKKNIDRVLSHTPPLIGLIRDFENIPDIQKKIL